MIFLVKIFFKEIYSLIWYNGSSLIVNQCVIYHQQCQRHSILSNNPLNPWKPRGRHKKNFGTYPKEYVFPCGTSQPCPWFFIGPTQDLATSLATSRFCFRQKNSCRSLPLLGTEHVDVLHPRHHTTYMTSSETTMTSLRHLWRHFTLSNIFFMSLWIITTWVPRPRYPVGICSIDFFMSAPCENPLKFF